MVGRIFYVKRRNLIGLLWRADLDKVVERFDLPRHRSMVKQQIEVLRAWSDNPEVGVMVFDLLMKEAQL